MTFKFHELGDVLEFEIPERPIRLLVTGARGWHEERPVDVVFRRIHGIVKDAVILMHGGCRGLDLMAGAKAKDKGWEVLSRPADWGRFGKGAGPVRNQEMLEEHRPHIGIAFHEDLTTSKGTLDMVTRLLEAKVPTFHVDLKAVRRLGGSDNLFTFKGFYDQPH